MSGSNDNVLAGGCFCGAIRYEAGGEPFQLTNCHCANCRRLSAAPLVAWFSVRRPAFRYTRGEPARFNSSLIGVRSFCALCGTQLTFERRDLSDEIDVTICSLDDPERLPPEDHTWTQRRLGWIVLADGLPQYRQARAPE